MKTACRNLAALALLALAAVATSAATAQFRKIAPEAVRKQVEVSMLLTGTIDIEPDGSVSGYVLDDRAKVPGYVASLLDRRVPAWRFEPVMRGGQAMAVRSPMSLRVVAKPLDGDNFALSISGVSFGGDSTTTDYVTRDRMDPPSYPVAMSRIGASGTVYLLLQIGRDGRVSDLLVEQVNLAVLDTEDQMARMRKQFGDAATAAAWNWTYHPPTTGEEVDDPHWTVRVPVSFELDGDKPAGYGQWQAYLPGPRARAAWAHDGASPDAIAGGGVYPVGGGVKLITPLQEG